jgi:hypothetical protein
VHPAHGEDVLEGQRHAVQRAAVLPGGDLLFGAPGALQRRLGEEGDEGVQAWVQRLGARQRGTRQRDGGELAAAKPLGHLAQRPPLRIRHPASPSGIGLTAPPLPPTAPTVGL